MPMSSFVTLTKIHLEANCIDKKKRSAESLVNVTGYQFSLAYSFSKAVLAEPATRNSPILGTLTWLLSRKTDCTVS